MTAPTCRRCGVALEVSACRVFGAVVEHRCWACGLDQKLVFIATKWTHIR